MTLLDTLSPDDVVATTRTLVKLGEPPALEYALLPDAMGVCLRAEDGSPLVQIDFGSYGVLWVCRSDLRVLSAPALTDPDSTWDMYVAEARESARLRESMLDVLRESWIPAPVLHEFGCRCAEQALALVDTPDPRSVAAIATKRAWLRGEATDDELAAARAAAHDAACAAWDAAWDAAGDAALAAWDAAGDAALAAAWAAWAAWDAAGDAALAAARDAARAAARAAAWAAWAAWAAARDAARGAAWDAACAAARDAQVDLLIALLAPVEA